MNQNNENPQDLPKYEQLPAEDRARLRLRYGLFGIVTFCLGLGLLIGSFFDSWLTRGLGIVVMISGPGIIALIFILRWRPWPEYD